MILGEFSTIFVHSVGVRPAGKAAVLSQFRLLAVIRRYISV